MLSENLEVSKILGSNIVFPEREGTRERALKELFSSGVPAETGSTIGAMVSIRGANPFDQWPH